MLDKTTVRTCPKITFTSSVKVVILPLEAKSWKR